MLARPASPACSIPRAPARRFIGLTNIRDARGDQIEAEIVFAAAPRQVDPGQWQAAPGTALTNCTLGR